MYIDYIKKEGNDTLIIKLSDIHKIEFSAELITEDGKYLEEFSTELVKTIRQKYPNFKKGTIKILCGTVIVATLQINGSHLLINASNTTNITATVTSIKRFSMSYLYYGTPEMQLKIINNTQDSLNMVSPSYFDLDESGNLKITSLYSKTFVDGAHEKGISVVPFVSNHWNRQTGINALENREKLSTDIANAVNEYDLDGVQVDIENVTDSERDKYTDFVKLLREKIAAGKEVSVAVSANPFGWTGGWQGSYDYEQLAKYSDYLMIMAYDEHYQNGPEGPVASFNFVEKSIQYALKYTTSDKIVLGLPFYGRYWQEGADSGGYSIDLGTVYELIDKYDSAVTYDYNEKSAEAVITIKENDIKPIVGYKTLSAGTYHIWFEDDTSMREKLLLADKYNLKGIGSWSLGQEENELWNYYTKWLNGVYFNDIASNWAREEILDSVLRGDMKGVNSTSFEPNRNITRAEFVTLLLRKFNISVNEDTVNTFPDTVTHWASREIATASENGIILGGDDGNFHPDKEVTRGEAALILARLMNLDMDNVNDAGFWDVKSDSYYKNAINAVVNSGIFKGYKDGSFKPQQGFTRAETAVVTGRLK